MDEFPNTRGYSVSWTQPYTTLNSWFASPQVTSLVRDAQVEEELIRIDAVDNIVQNMLTYPDADAIINKIKQKRGLSND